ncbi:magnesium transporter CorA family protein [Alkalithermobacter paradoxus]
MKIKNINKNTMHCDDIYSNWYNKEDSYFILCKEKEILNLQHIFEFEDDTIEECIYDDEKVRFESFKEYDFISLNNLSWENKNVILEEINIYIGYNYIILVGEQSGNEIEEIYDYISLKISNLTHEKKELNKIYFWIFDMILKNYINTLESVEEDILTLENNIINEIEKRYFSQINCIRQQMDKITKNLRALLYVGDQFMINENKFIKRENQRYFRNIDVRINKLYDFSISLKSRSDQLIYLHNSGLTSHTNDIATRLTVLAIFFGPLTVITGIYGMNFDYMPELHWIYGYQFTLGIMATLTIILYAVFKKKKWL